MTGPGEADLFGPQDGPDLCLRGISDLKGRKHRLKGESSLNHVSDRPLANLISSFRVRSLWKTISNPFSFGVFMLKILPVRIPSLLHKQPTQQHPLKCVLFVPPAPHPWVALASLPVGIHSEPPVMGGSRERGRYLCGSGRPGPFVHVIMSQSE